MKLQYVSFELAKMLKEIGFDIPVISLYTDRLIEDCGNTIQHNKYKDYYSAPTLELAKMWFWEKHKIHIGFSIDINGYIAFKIKKYNRGDNSWDTQHAIQREVKDPIVSLENALLRACQIIKEK